MPLKKADRRVTLVVLMAAALTALDGCLPDVSGGGLPLPIPSTETKKPPPPDRPSEPAPATPFATNQLPSPTEDMSQPELTLPPTEPPPPTGEGGIEGLVLIGPMCPVQREGQPCPDQPYQATISVLDASGRQVARAQSDAQGGFRLDLPAGDYTLRPEPGPGIEHAGEQQVRVSAGAYTQVTISYDSGIR